MSKNKKSLIYIILCCVAFLTVYLITTFVTTGEILEGIIYALVFIISGYRVLWKALNNITRGKVFDENFLMTIASLGAMLIGEYPEAIAVMLFYQVGELFEKVAVGKTRRSIADLMDIAPGYANVYNDGVWEERELQDVKIGDRLLVKMGEKVAVDGIVISGNSSFETAALTGESVPKEILEGEDILSGYVNIGSAIEMQATKEYNDSTVAKILELVENSASRKSKSEMFITRFSKYYTPSVVTIAILLAILPPLIIGNGWSEWIHRALMFLVVSCPCALVISVPLGFFAGIGAASRLGVLVKGSNYFEQLDKTDIIFMDKTGTITKGVFEIEKIYSSVNEDEFLKILASIENYSNHPIAKSIQNYYKGELLSCETQEIAGRGIEAEIKGNKYYVGNYELAKIYDNSAIKATESGTIVYLVKENKCLGYVVVNDIIKDDSKEAIENLKKMDCSVVMLTGDNKETAKKIADEVGVEYYAELLPQNKVEIIEKAILNKENKKTVAFAGDGVNDAPSLSRADVGIAMGGVGSEVAIESADIVLMNDNLSAIVMAKKIAKKTMNIVKENIIFALLIKFAILILSALGLTNMWFAVFADVGVSVIAILNSIRALKQNN